MLFLLFCVLLLVKVNNFVNSNALPLKTSLDNFKTINNNFEILGGAIDFTPISVNEKECDYSTTCPSIICKILSNKTLSSMGLAYVILFPIESLKCSKVISILNATIITFIMSYEEKFITPIACNNLGECFTKTCILFNADKNNIGLGFTGQCH